MKGFLRLRGNYYYFRCRVPQDLYGTFFTGEEILKALHTKDKKLAQDAAAEWYCRTTRIFHYAESRAFLPISFSGEIIERLTAAAELRAYSAPWGPRFRRDRDRHSAGNMTTIPEHGDRQRDVVAR